MPCQTCVGYNVLYPRIYLDLDMIARLIMSLLPHKGPYTLSMERTNWQFGPTDINALVLGINYEGLAFPILFRLPSKRGNSNTSE
jgi:hypothetical protein